MMPTRSSSSGHVFHAQPLSFAPSAVLQNPEILEDKKIYDMVVNKLYRNQVTLSPRVDLAQTEYVTGADLKFYLHYAMPVDRVIESIKEITHPSQMKTGLTEKPQPTTARVERQYPRICKIIEALQNGGTPAVCPRLLRQVEVARRYATHSFEEVIVSLYPHWKGLISSSMENMVFSGWKIHVSATLDTCERIAKVVVPYLFYRNINSKICSNREYLRILGESETQRGKFITIYPKDCKDADTIAYEINSLLSYFELDQLPKERIFGDAHIGDSGHVFIRYGKLRRRHDYDDAATMPGYDRKSVIRVQDKRFFPFPAPLIDMDHHFNQDVIWSFPGTHFIMDLKAMRSVGSHLEDAIDPYFIIPMIKENATREELLKFSKTYLEITNHLLEINEVIKDKRDMSHIHEWSVQVADFIKKRLDK